MKKKYKSKSYTQCHCHGDCFMLGANKNKNEPCWGEVVAIDEILDEDESYWIHACEGHEGMYQSGDEYIPEQ